MLLLSLRLATPCSTFVFATFVSGFQAGKIVRLACCGTGVLSLLTLTALPVLPSSLSSRFPENARHKENTSASSGVSRLTPHTVTSSTTRLVA
uniref:Uncharacterized protein n=1 Tax=Timema monikensis TaxID=170555 RepID=A0A7R9EJL4_9NEOP|nr:unnamed protein product [Timema monikensis]